MKKLTILILLAVLSSHAYAQRVEYLADSLVKKKVVKMDFFSPLTGNLTLGYEQYFNNFTGIEAKIGIIGIGIQTDYEASGVFLKVGPKFKLKPNYAVDGTFSTHPLRGTYIKPEIAFSSFQFEEQFDDVFIDQDKKDITSFAILINFGNQYVLGNIMTFGWHLGLGYGFSSDDGQGYYFGYVAGTKEFPIAYSNGVSIGFLLK